MTLVIIPGGCVISTVCVALHAGLPAVTVQLQVPAVNALTEAVPSPIGFPGDQLYVYGNVPPVAVTEADPLL
jgi:hypothetical protein